MPLARLGLSLESYALAAPNNLPEGQTLDSQRPVAHGPLDRGKVGMEVAERAAAFESEPPAPDATPAAMRSLGNEPGRRRTAGACGGSAAEAFAVNVAETFAANVAEISAPVEASAASAPVEAFAAPVVTSAASDAEAYVVKASVAETFVVSVAEAFVEFESVAGASVVSASEGSVAEMPAAPDASSTATATAVTAEQVVGAAQNAFAAVPHGLPAAACAA